MNCPQILRENRKARNCYFRLLKSLKNKENFSRSKISVSNLIVVIKFQKTDAQNKRKTKNAKKETKLN